MRSLNERTLDALALVRAERARQDAKWGGGRDSPDGTGTPTQVDRARQARDACDLAAREHRKTWRHILVEEVSEALAEKSETRLRAELVQVAAVATAWVEAIDARGGR